MISYIKGDIHARYLFLVRLKFNHDIDAAPKEPCILALNNRNVYILKFYLPTGTYKTLATNDFGLDRNRYMTNMNEFVGHLSRHLPEYMDVDTLTEKFSIIRAIFSLPYHTGDRMRKAAINLQLFIFQAG